MSEGLFSSYSQLVSVSYIQTIFHLLVKYYSQVAVWCKCWSTMSDVPMCVEQLTAIGWVDWEIILKFFIVNWSPIMTQNRFCARFFSWLYVSSSTLFSAARLKICTYVIFISFCHYFEENFISYSHSQIILHHNGLTHLQTGTCIPTLIDACKIWIKIIKAVFIIKKFATGTVLASFYWFFVMIQLFTARVWYDMSRFKMSKLKIA